MPAKTRNAQEVGTLMTDFIHWKDQYNIIKAQRTFVADGERMRVPSAYELLLFHGLTIYGSGELRLEGTGELIILST